MAKCCPETCDLSQKKLVLQKRCMPVRIFQNDAPVTIFNAGTLPITQFPTGIITFSNINPSNVGVGCAFVYTITDSRGTFDLILNRGMSTTFLVNGLRLIVGNCEPGTATIGCVCFGNVEMDLQYYTSC